MEIAIVGALQPHDDVEEWLTSRPCELAFLPGRKLRLVFDDCLDDGDIEVINAAVRTMFAAAPSLLTEVESDVFQYFRDMKSLGYDAESTSLDIKNAHDVWQHVTFGDELHVTRREEGDAEDGIYFSLECNCDWEVEHGLQIVIRNGSKVTKVGPYDGHLTNADAFADPALVGLVYARIRSASE